MPARNRLSFLALLPLLSVFPLAAQSPLAAQAPPAAPGPTPALPLGGLLHQAAPGFTADPAAAGCSIVRAYPERAGEERRGCEAPRPSFRGLIFEWLEAPGAISLFPATLEAGALEAGARAAADAAPLLFGPVATVRLASADPERADPGASVDFLQLDSFRASRSPRPDFRRRASAAEAAAGVALPAGLVVAALRGKNGTLLTRPTAAAAGAVTALFPAPPATGRADLLLILPRSRAFRAYDRDHEVRPFLRRGGDPPRRPDQLASSGDRVIALFYDLPAGNWRVGAESAAYRLAEAELALAGGEARIAQLPLDPLPHLGAQLAMPAGLRNGPLELEVFDLASGEQLAAIEAVDPRSERVDFGYLAPAELEVRLLADNWLFKQVADLRSGEDAEVRFAPQPIVVSGAVTREGRPFETFVLFSPGGPERPEGTRTDAGGRYETVVFRSGFFPVIFDMGPDKPAFIREVTLPDAPEAILDFEIPGGERRVAVLDAENHQPIPSPFIYLELLGGEKPMRMSFVAGEEGLLELPPLAGSQLVVSASAESYLRSPPQTFEVAQLAPQHELQILLEKAADPRPLGFTGPDGRPAAGLEVRAQAALDDSPPAFEGFTDAEGRIEVPAQAEGLYLLWRDPSGRLASGFTSYSPGDAGGPSEIAVGAAVQLVARVVERGGAPAADAALFLFAAGGERIEGDALQFLHGSRASDAFGYFRARGMAAAPAALLAFGAGRKSTELAPLATQLSWPWPQVVQLEKVE